VIDRTAFAAARGVDLDPFQHRACDALDRGHSVLVAAPTGSGKTLVAEYAIEAALTGNAKAFYTTPLKALSNQKFTDFTTRYGRARVGLLTGDNTINGEAPVVVMTTEVLRNMIYAESPTLDGLGVVVLDEVHYLQDRYRGPVWEEVIVHLEHTVPLVCLSATVSNAVEVAEWIATVRGDTEPVVEERRPVALRDLYLVGERGRDGLTLLPTFVTAPNTKRGLAPNPDAQRLGRGGSAGPRPRARGRLRTPTRDEVVELLDRENMLPAIVFVFSRAGCDQAVEHARSAAVRLTTPDERERIRAIAEAHTASLADDELEVLGYSAWLDALEAGIAAHHAGLVPPLKEAVEEAFTTGLVKVVYATETLALGVNMPARTVVIEKLTKFTGERHEFLTAGEYTQLTGRAGRRGIDELGFAVVCWSPFVTFDQVASLAGRGSDPLVSAFRPTYNMAANLVARYDRETAHRLLNSSFAQFRADRDVVALERELSRAIARRDRERTAHAEPDAASHDPRPPARDRRAVERALDRLQPGDVVLVGRRNTRMVVIAHAGRGRGEGRGSARVLAVDPGRDVRRLGPDDFGAPPEPVARVELPDPYAPRSPAFRRMVADAGRRAKVRAGNGDGAPSPREAARDRNDDRRTAGASASSRQDREVQRLERRVRARSESLARQFDRVLGLLESWGYVEEWGLTDAGRLLARLSHECDLLLAEAIRDGVFRNLSAAELAAVVSCFTYERRGPDDARGAAQLRWPSNAVARAVRGIERRWRDLNAAEDDHRLPETRSVDPGFVDAMFEWARGDALALVLDDEVSAGDFVRQVKQCIDVLRQVADVDPDPAVATTARDAARACLRGVVAAASAVGVESP
jgi:ATP-dependent RNA helicase HelY